MNDTAAIPATQPVELNKEITKLKQWFIDSCFPADKAPYGGTPVVVAVEAIAMIECLLSALSQPAMAAGCGEALTEDDIKELLRIADPMMLGNLWQCSGKELLRFAQAAQHIGFIHPAPLPVRMEKVDCSACHGTRKEFKGFDCRACANSVQNGNGSQAAPLPVRSAPVPEGIVALERKHLESLLCDFDNDCTLPSVIAARATINPTSAGSDKT
jgi:hypothetical protein